MDSNINEKFVSFFEKQEYKDKQAYLNDILKAYGAKETLLNYKDIEEILSIVNELEQLKKKGITSNNFTHKAKAFKKHIKALEEDFGYKIKNKSLPFNRPTDLKIKLDNLLLEIGLNNEQIKEVTRELLNDESRRPKEKTIQPLFKTKLNKEGKINFVIKSEYITPLVKKEHYKKFNSTNERMPFNITIEISKNELSLLNKFVTEKYGDYYLNDAEPFLKDIIQNEIDELIEELKKQ